MKAAAVLFPIALALGAITFSPGLVRAQDFRQEGPIEIEKCQTIDKPGSYKLVKNLTAAAGADCLTITVGFVTIDLAGFSISGSGSGGGRTAVVAADGVANITVRNGSISVFLNGVALGSGSIVEGLRVNGLGPFVPGGGSGIIATGIVRGNTVASVGSGPGGAGVGISAIGIVTGNFVRDNGHGMEIGAGSTVIGNTALSNRVEGITVFCPSNVTDNTAVDTIFGPNLVLNGDGCNNTNNVAP